MSIEQSQLTPLPASVRDVLAERFQQVTRYGHTGQADDESPRGHLPRTAHVFLVDACDIVSRKPNQAQLQRARRKTIQAAALCLAEIERIDRELAPRLDINLTRGVPHP